MRSRRPSVTATRPKLVAALAVVLVSLAGPLASCSQSRTQANLQTADPTSSVSTIDRSPGPTNALGTTTLVLEDPERSMPGRLGGAAPRQVQAVVRFPVDSAGNLSQGTHPLVVFAHGYQTTTQAYSQLLDDLALKGSVVVAPEFPGESTALSGPVDRGDLDQESCDLGMLADLALQAPPPELDGRRLRGVVYVGHSDGALAAAEVGFAPMCGTTKTQGVVVLSGDIPSEFRDSPPLLAIVGTDDEVNPAYNTQRLWEQAPSQSWLVTVNGGSHAGPFMGDDNTDAVAALIDAFVHGVTNSLLIQDFSSPLFDPSLDLDLILASTIDPYRLTLFASTIPRLGPFMIAPSPPTDQDSPIQDSPIQDSSSQDQSNQAIASPDTPPRPTTPLLEPSLVTS